MPRSRVPGCAIWRVWAAPGLHSPAKPGSAGRPLHAAALAPMPRASPPARRRAPERPDRAPAQTISWHQPSSGLRAVVQRVSRAAVTPGGEIGAGLCVLLGIAETDDESAAARLAGKIVRLRIFEGSDGKFDRSLLDVGGAALVVSQFTLIADTRRQKGTRPDFSGAAPKEQAEPLYERFCQALRDLGVHVETGVFGAHMALELVNDGPVTIILDT